MPAPPPFLCLARGAAVGFTTQNTERDIAEVARSYWLIGGLWADWSNAK